MKLFKVQYDVKSHHQIIKYITAISKAKAIQKYYEQKDIQSSWDVKAEYICEREVIIPTVDPIMEFADLKD